MILFAEHHYQDKSVWDVIQIYLHQLLRTQDMLAKARRGPPFDYKALNASNLKDISETLDILNKDLERMKLATSIQKLRAVRKFVNKLIEKPPKGEMSVKFQATLLGIAMDELNATVEYDLIASLTYYFSVKERELLRQKGKKFGAEVWKKFPEAHNDLNEAVRCMGFSCWTASVCHLVRAVECVLHVVSDKLGVTVQPNWNWNTIIKKMQKKVDAMPRGDEKEYWTDVILQFVCIKNCTRLKSMHVQPGYTFDREGADKMFQAVKGFLQSLADAIS